MQARRKICGDLGSLVILINNLIKFVAKLMGKQRDCGYPPLLTITPSSSDMVVQRSLFICEISEEEYLFKDHIRFTDILSKYFHSPSIS